MIFPVKADKNGDLFFCVCLNTAGMCMWIQGIRTPILGLWEMPPGKSLEKKKRRQFKFHTRFLNITFPCLFLVFCYHPSAYFLIFSSGSLFACMWMMIEILRELLFSTFINVSQLILLFSCWQPAKINLQWILKRSGKQKLDPKFVADNYLIRSLSRKYLTTYTSLFLSSPWYTNTRTFLPSSTRRTSLD